MPDRKPTIIQLPGRDTNELPSLAEERKPTVINLNPNQCGETDGPRVPHILHLEEHEDVRDTQRLPTVIMVPKVVEEVPAPARTPTVVKFLFEEKPLVPSPAVAATILKLPGAEIRARLKVSDGDLAELFPNVPDAIREKARVVVVSTNVDTLFTQTCGSWGQLSQQQMLSLSEEIAKLNSHNLLAEMRAEMRAIYDFFMTFKARVQEEPKSMLDFLSSKTPKTAKQRFDELMLELENKASKLGARLPEIQKLQLQIAETSGKLAKVRESMQVDMVAGQLVEFRGMLGEVKADKEFVKSDLEILNSRIESLRASVSTVDILRDQLTALYLEVATLQTTIQNTLLVEVPEWRLSVSLTGFEQSGRVSNSQGWSFVDQLIQKLKSKP